jgi:predicted ATPase/class 3 adenylate cyclase/Tfp pilus assembly protein PilF
MVAPPSGTVTFLFTDIEGSSRMWEKSPQTMRTALARHDEILRSAIEDQGGHVFKTVGDAFCAAFPTVTDALEAALCAQRTLFAEEWEGTGPLRVRTALHVGAAEERDGDYFGPPLNRIARLLAAGHGGQVLLSAAAQEMVRDQLPGGTTLIDLGEQRLKDLFRPERIFQLTALGLPSEFPPLRTLESRPNNLPLQPTPLVGREREVAEVIGRVQSEEVRLLTLTGPGGTGKTRLALQAAAELLEKFDDGVFFVSLAALTDPELVPSTVAEPLGVTEAAHRPLEEDLKEYLKDKELLLLVDNFEQVLEATSLVDELSASCRGLKVLATSRVPLGLYGEHEYAVPPLSMPNVRHLPNLKALSQYEAVRLFVDQAKAAKADFAVTDENAPAVAEICVRLDGLPLAIELAAARVKVLTPQKMLSRFSNRLKLLTGGARNLPERQRTLRGAIEWSYELLDEGDRELFGRLSVFAGGRTLEAIEAVCDAEDDLPMDVLDGVESLVDKSLLRQEEGPEGEPRFVMLETIHEFAREKLEESGETKDIKRAHAGYFLALAEEAEPELVGPDQAGWMDRLEAEHDNLRAALSWSLEGEDPELGLGLASALSYFWYMRGYWSEGRGWLEKALAGNAEAPTEARAKVLRELAYLAIAQGDYARVGTLAEEALSLYRGLGDEKGVAGSLEALGWASMYRGDLERAEALLEQSLAAARESDDARSIALALNALAVLAANLGDFERAEALWEEATESARKLGDHRLVMPGIVNMGYARAVRGDFDRAEALCEEALAISRKLKDAYGNSEALLNLGMVATRRGDHGRAKTLLEEGLVLSRKLGSRDSIAEGLETLAEMAEALGDAPRAAQLWGAADALREAIGSPWRLMERRLHEPYLETARSRMDEADWTKAWEEGRAMTLEDAIAYALEGERA